MFQFLSVGCFGPTAPFGKRLQLPKAKRSVAIGVKPIEPLRQLRSDFVFSDLGVSILVEPPVDQVCTLVIVARLSQKDVGRLVSQQEAEKGVVVQSIAFAVCLPQCDHLE